MIRLVSIFLIVGLVGCGGDKGEAAPAAKKAAPAVKKAVPAPKKAAPAPKKAAPAPKKAAAPAPKAVTDDGVTATVNLTGNDMMKFNVNEIRVAAGRKVKLTLTHVGKLPGAAMGHNFVLLKPGVDVQAFATKAINAKPTDYVPADEAANVIAHTKVVGGGESTTIEFAAPAKGTYTYICSFPGHYAMMKGQFIVE
jgi:azurin